jgi:chromosome partitioning protein
MRVLAVGLEVSQKSLTKAILPQVEVNSLQDVKDNPEYGLWEVARKEKKIEDVIKKCNLSSLHCIPETANLGLLDEHIEKATLREFFLQRLLDPVIDQYDIILFDNSSYYRSHLVKNALAMATDVLCPLGCEVGAFQSVLEGIELINNFKRDMSLKWEHFNFVPTLRDNRRLSSEIETFYRSNLGNSITTSTIHAYKAVAEESIVEQLSVTEYNSKSPLADDYYNLLTELYGKKESL